MSYPGSGWPGDPSGQNPAQPPASGQPGYGQQPPSHQPPFEPPAQTTQFPAYGQQPGAYGQQPGAYGQPPVPPVAPGYGTPYGPQPPRRGGSNTPLIAAIVVLLLIAGGVAAFFLLKSDDKPKHKAGPTQVVTTSAPSSSFPSSPSLPSSASVPTESSSVPTDTTTSASAVTESDARKVVVRYLQDVNAQNRSDAATLICPNLVDTWRNSIDKPRGDFTVQVTKAIFEGSTPATDGSNGLDLKYSLSVKDLTSPKTGVSPVTFTIEDKAGGLKICGEK